MGAVWAIAEQFEGRLRTVSYELLTRGRDLADKLARRGEADARLVSVVLGHRVAPDDVQRLIHSGADQVLLAQHPDLAHFRVEPYARVIERLAREHRPDVALAAATTTGRTLMPYLAVRLTTGLTADCTGLDVDPDTGNLIQTRPAIGGNILATIITAEHRPQMATVRPRSVKPPTPDTARRGEVVTVRVRTEDVACRTEWVSFRPIEQDEANIQDADKVVTGGRGLKKAENFALVRRMAEALGASVGASREAVDRGWVGYPHQVGLSGKTVTPSLYLALGVSGAIQHLAGMKTSECIVAVNSDPDAQIFQVADFGVVGDLFEFVPALVAELERRKAASAGGGRGA
jgi:electron transfer flavoprotein alpha subunit